VNYIETDSLNLEGTNLAASKKVERAYSAHCVIDSCNLVEHFPMLKQIGAFTNAMLLQNRTSGIYRVTSDVSYSPGDRRRCCEASPVF